MKAGVRLSFLFFSLNQHLIVIEEALNKRLSKVLSFLKNPLKSSGIVKTTWR